MAAPLPWEPPVATALESRLAAWADLASSSTGGVRWPSGGALGDVRWRGVESLSAAAIAALVGESSSVAVALFAAARATPAAIAVVPGALARALARAALGARPDTLDEPDELDAPRPASTVERALVAAAIAAAASRAGLDARVALDRPAAPAGPAAVVHLAVSAPRPGAIAVVVPAVPAPRPRGLGELADRAARLPAVRATVEVARGALPASASARLATLARGDVIVVGPRAAALRIARGRVAGALDLAAGQLTVRAPYERAAMNDDLADDLSIPLTVVAGEVAVSARALLELAPGAVLPLGRPLTGAVELWAGRRRVGRGELVEVDGALGVRVAELFDEDPRAAAPAISAPR